MTLKQIYTRLFFDFPYSFLVYLGLALNAMSGIKTLLFGFIAYAIFIPAFLFWVTNKKL